MALTDVQTIYDVTDIINFKKSPLTIIVLHKDIFGLFFIHDYKLIV